MLSARPWATQRTCPCCGEVFTAKHHLQTFLDPSHKKAWDHRNQVRGQRITLAAQAWRASRNLRNDPEAKRIGREAMAELAALADLWNAEDREAGRPQAVANFDARQNRAVRP